MIIKKSDLAKVAVYKSQYPELILPEVAFAGRSNVGKSSLINRLLNRKALARISSTPGKTRTINFYIVNEEIYFVDLPGYGYAKVSKAEKESWGGIIEGYLTGRESLKLVVLLVDIRHEPTEDDKLMFEWLKVTSAKRVVVATKSDKLSKSQRLRSSAVIKKSLQLGDDDVFMTFSSETGDGREELLNLIEEICVPHQ